MLRVLVVAVLLAGLTGCGNSNDGEVLPETPPPEGNPKVATEPAFRPVFVLAGRSASAGTAFVIKAPSGKLLALTAAHVLDKPEWASVTSTSLSSMSGGRLIELQGRPVYVGRSFDELPPVENGSFPVFDTTEDFVVWYLPGGAAITPLDLADHDPRVNEWVWVVGQEPGKPLQFFRAKVTRVKSGAFVMKQHDRFEPKGFSGGPVLTSDGKVIGNMLAADRSSGLLEGATASTIRQRVSSY
jgi:S1-C subfamily serine protease